MTPEQFAERKRRLDALSPVAVPVQRPKVTPKRKPRKPPTMSEKAVLRACIDILDTHPRIAFWWRQNTGGMKDAMGVYVKFSFKGASDLMAVVSGSGRFLACECKATGKAVSQEQQNFLTNLLDAGGYAICCDHPDKLREYLRHVLA